MALPSWFLRLYFKKASGVGINKSVIDAYDEIKLGKKGADKFRYVFFKLSDDLREIVVEKKAGAEKDFGDFIADLPKVFIRF